MAWKLTKVVWVLLLIYAFLYGDCGPLVHNFGGSCEPDDNFGLLGSVSQREGVMRPAQ
jgi:hypothetical protein